jgi:polysaccharide biosynthesis/export protein
MRPRIFRALAMIVCLAGLSQAQSQDRTQQPQPANGGSTWDQPGMDVQGIRNYKLGPGDVLDIRVFGQSDLNAVVDVDANGNISSLPFVETPIPAQCRTERDVQKDIALAYAKFLKNPQVSVRIAERRSHPPATIFGAVRMPTRIQMLRNVRLNEIMAASGGFTEKASGTIQILHTTPVMCPNPGEEAEAAPLDINKLPFQVVKIADLKAGKAEGNPLIRPGDYILVTEAEPVYVTGSVWNPQPVYMKDQMTVSMALAAVGGARKEAKLTDIRVYRQKPGSQEQDMIKVDLAAIKKHQQPDVLLQAYDVIEVPEASMFSAGRLPTTISGFFGAGLQTTFQTLPTRVIP